MVVLNGFGSGLLYGTFCGAGFETGEDGASVCVDSSESIYVAGWTNSPFYPVTPGAFDTLLNIAGPTPPFSAFDGFIQKHASVPPSSLPGVVAFGAGTPGCQGPIQLRVNSTPKTNNPLFEFNCLHAPPKSLGLLLLSNERDGAGSDALGLGVAFHVGLYTPELYALDTPSTALGSGTTRLAIPNDPALVNRLYFAQAFWVWPAGGCQPTPSGLSSSNGVALTIQP
jgi:hypothetical protein